MRKTAAFALTLLGLFDSLYLLWAYTSSSIPMLCLGSGCDVVRASRYAHIFGVPTPAYGIAMYSVLAALIFAEPLVSASQSSWLRRATAAIAGVGLAGSLVLSGIEQFVIHAWCAWCVVQAVAVTIIFVLALASLGSSYADRRAGRVAASQYVTVLLVALAVGSPAFYLLQRHAAKAVESAAAAPLTNSQSAQLVRPESHVTGNPEAAVTLVEFGDIQCPACVATAPTIVKLRQLYADRVRFVFREFPLPQLHMYAEGAAEAAECAGQQGKFWPALDRFYKANGNLGDADLERYASELGVDMEKFRACVTSHATRPQIERDREDGSALGVRGTPTFFLGNRRIVGPMELSRFEQLLNEDLASAGTPAKVTASGGQAPPSSKPVTATPAAAAKKPKSGSASTAGSSPFLEFKASSIDCSEIAPGGPEPKLIHTAEAEKLAQSGALFVDVRSADDFRAGHITGAINIPMIESERRVSELPKDLDIVLYESGNGGAADTCAASRAVGRVLLSRGFKNVVVYQDGLAGWRKQGLRTEP
ncbi:MAG: thioredoxin domain-containing protein [Terriglobales bacterium]